MARFQLIVFSLFLISSSLLLTVALSKTLKRDGLNEIKASLGWRVVYAWVGDDPDGDLPPLSSVTCSTQGDYRVVTELEVYAVSIIGPFPIVVTNLLDLTRLMVLEVGTSNSPQAGLMKPISPAMSCSIWHLSLH